MRMEKKNYNKPRLAVWIVISIAVMLAIMGIVWIIMAFAFPRNFADFTYKLNMTSYTRTLYMRDYNKSNNVNSIYMATNLSIKLEDYDQVIGCYDKLRSHKDYAGLIKQVDADNAKLQVSALTKSTLLNEDEYLKNNYVLALIKVNKWQEALQYANADFATTEPTATNTGNYLYGNIIKYMPLAGATAFEGSTLDSINAYYTKLDDLITNHFDINHEVEMIALCNKIIRVGNNLKVLNTALEIDASDAVEVTMSKANSALATLLGE